MHTRLAVPGLRQALDTYRAGRAYGDKEHQRRTDIAARSISPQKLYGVPVGLMFSRALIDPAVPVPAKRGSYRKLQPAAKISN